MTTSGRTPKSHGRDADQQHFTVPAVSRRHAHSTGSERCSLRGAWSYPGVWHVATPAAKHSVTTASRRPLATPGLASLALLLRCRGLPRLRLLPPRSFLVFVVEHADTSKEQPACICRRAGWLRASHHVSCRTVSLGSGTFWVTCACPAGNAQQSIHNFVARPVEHQVSGTKTVETLSPTHRLHGSSLLWLIFRIL